MAIITTTMVTTITTATTITMAITITMVPTANTGTIVVKFLFGKNCAVRQKILKQSGCQDAPFKSRGNPIRCPCFFHCFEILCKNPFTERIFTER